MELELDAFLAALVEELSISPRQIQAVIAMLDEGGTIPFIARYRKEVHGNLDEVQIAKIQERTQYYREFLARRNTILKSIADQDKLTDALRDKIMACKLRTELEDIYLPYKPKRRTRAMIARERGLAPLADLILAQGDEPHDATTYINAELGVDSELIAWAGARDIVAETIAEHADVRGFARNWLADTGMLTSAVVSPKPEQPTKFEQYYEYSEALSHIPSHRFLAIRRGETEGILRSHMTCDSDPIIAKALDVFPLREASPFSADLRKATEDGYKRLIAPSIEVDVAVELKLKSDRAAVDIFAENLRHLLLQPPLGEKPVLGIDPGIRTGCKCVGLDATGKYLGTVTIYPQQSERSEMEASVEICKLVSRYEPQAIAIGNGTGGRTTEAFVNQTLQRANRPELLVISVNESGASVYSASEVARDEFPDLDLTIRGAISIGRRLQDPLSELVKIDPKAIGVGQYQHDVNQTLLATKLDDVIVSCVNHVGVELNTASTPLLTHVAGIGPSLAKRIVDYRNEHGAFTSRADLLKISGLGAKTFEQAAGFLRIHNAENPLDQSAVHPERYTLVKRIASDLGTTVTELIGNEMLIGKIKPTLYVSDDIGLATLQDIIAELRKPGRDPRAAFERPAFRDDILSIEDVKPGLSLEGIVTNVTAFGAFVDIGVHQDGLVHISELADRYIKDPSEVVKTGDKLKVRVLDVDIARKRISLSARTKPSPSGNDHGGKHSRPTGGQRPDRRSGGSPRSTGFANNPFSGL